MASEAKTITTQGDLIVGGASAALTRLGVGAAGKGLASENGTDPTWAYRARNFFQGRNANGISVATTSYATMLDATGSLTANMLAVGDVIVVNAAGMIYNNSGAARTYYFQLANNSTVAQMLGPAGQPTGTTVSNATQRYWKLQMTGVVYATGTTLVSAIAWGYEWWWSAANGGTSSATAGAAQFANTISIIGSDLSTPTTTNALTIDLQMKSDSATATQTCWVQSFALSILPKAAG